MQFETPPAAGWPQIEADTRRFPVCRPGQLVYSASIDEGKIMNWQRCCRCSLCAPDIVARRTFVDVYNNAVVVNSAFSYCCCLYCDNVRTLYFDRPPFYDPVTPVGCCNPFPQPCLHFCGFAGEGLVFKGGVNGCPEVGFGHLFGWVGACFFPFNVVYGLQEGEAAKTSTVINREINKFRAAGGQFAQTENGYAKLMS